MGSWDRRNPKLKFLNKNQVKIKLKWRVKFTENSFHVMLFFINIKSKPPKTYYSNSGP